MAEKEPTNFNVGWGFPLRFGVDGRVASVGGTSDAAPRDSELRQAFHENMHHLVTTGRWERVMSPNFGISGKLYFFQPLQSTQPALLRLEIAEQIQLWVPRLVLREILATVHPKASKISIRVAAESAEFPIAVFAELVS